MQREREIESDLITIFSLIRNPSKRNEKSEIGVEIFSDKAHVGNRSIFGDVKSLGDSGLEYEIELATQRENHSETSEWKGIKSLRDTLDSMNISKHGKGQEIRVFQTSTPVISEDELRRLAEVQRRICRT